MTLGEYYYKTDFKNRLIHLKGKRGRCYQKHMIDTFRAYRNERVNEELTQMTADHCYIELYTRAKGGAIWDILKKR